MARRGLRFETEISWFVLAGALDVVMTFLLLRFSAEGQTRSKIIESNPVAQWVLARWGMPGLVSFKIFMTALVVVIAEFIGAVRPQLARTLLWGGTLIVGAVVAYSMRMLVLHR